MPTFSTPTDRAQVEQLMQPALIRVIDNLRKQLDGASWQGEYEEELVWPEGTTESQKQEYAELQTQLHGVPTEEHDRVASLMSELPQPAPLYTLRLTRKGFDDRTLDIWALCYQVCAKAYEADSETSIQADASLLDPSGEVDWRKLDDKTKALVESIFESLPNSVA